VTEFAVERGDQIDLELARPLVSTALAFEIDDTTRDESCRSDNDHETEQYPRPGEIDAEPAPRSVGIQWCRQSPRGGGAVSVLKPGGANWRGTVMRFSGATAKPTRHLDSPARAHGEPKSGPTESVPHTGNLGLARRTPGVLKFHALRPVVMPANQYALAGGTPQYGHRKSHPNIPKLSARAPGGTWKIVLVFTGRIRRAATYPKGTRSRPRD
jgi:hypothetical protein